MAVRVRLFAALREAAGAGLLEVEPASVRRLLDDLRATHGERFTRVLAVSSVLLGDERVAPDDDRPVPDGAELTLLPPVSGGA